MAKTIKKRQGTDNLPFAKNLKCIMDEKQLTVRAVAAMADVRPSVVMSWLSKANPHDLRAVGRLAKALSLNFKELLLGDTDEQDRVISINDICEEHEYFEGFCKIKVVQLIPKKGNNK